MKLIPPPSEAMASAPSKRDAEGRFLSGVGNGGSRGGRPRGARTKFTEQFFEDIRVAWARDGEAVISRAFFLDPVASLKAVAGLMPREAKLEVSRPLDGLSEEQLDKMLAIAEAKIAELGDNVIEGALVAVVTSAALPALDFEQTTRAQERAEAVRLDLIDETRRIEERSNGS